MGEKKHLIELSMTGTETRLQEWQEDQRKREFHSISSPFFPSEILTMTKGKSEAFGRPREREREGKGEGLTFKVDYIPSPYSP